MEPTTPIAVDPLAAAARPDATSAKHLIELEPIPYESLTVALFGTTSFVASGLLFAIQPIVAKMLLPKLGGSAAVWNTAMVFFQALLLCGYAFAHFAHGRLGRRSHRAVQLGVLAVPVLILPVALPQGWHGPGAVAPAVWVLLALGVMVGAPFSRCQRPRPLFRRGMPPLVTAVLRTPTFFMLRATPAVC